MKTGQTEKISLRIPGGLWGSTFEAALVGNGDVECYSCCKWGFELSFSKDGGGREEDGPTGENKGRCSWP